MAENTQGSVTGPELSATTPPVGTQTPVDTKKVGLGKWIYIVVAIAVIFVGVGGYFLFSALNKPAVIREKSSLTQSLFLDFKYSVEDIADHINETPSGSDVDSSERYSQKGSSLVKTASDSVDKLKAQIDKLDLPETQAYKKSLTDYISKSEELIKFERDDIKISQDYDSPRRDYEQLTKDLAGVANYMYSDPARYVKEVGSAIEKEDKIINTFESMNEEGLFKKSHEVFIKILKSERNYLQNVKDAVSNRDDSALAEAAKKYGEDSVNNAKELSRVKDEAKEKYKSVISDSKFLAGKVDQAYNSLKNQFNF